jgi:ABC-type transporter Mla subunit MlaD
VEKIAALIITARRHLAANSMIDLSALEGKVQALCDAAGEAPAQNTEEIRCSLTAILENLDQLTAQLTTQRDQILGTIENTLRQQAIGAYGETE